MRRRHDEPSRALRVFPARGAAASRCTLYEDDGLSLRYRDGDSAQMTFELKSTARTLVLRARKSGAFALPDEGVHIVWPPGERRPLRHLRTSGA